MYFQAQLIALLATLASVQALGINCRGNGNCASQGDNTLTEIHDKILALDQSKTFVNGQHLACAGGTGNACAFYQNVAGTQTAGQAAGQIAALLSHGCKICGSVPTNPGNDVSTGELTVNWVSNP